MSGRPPVSPMLPKGPGDDGAPKVRPKRVYRFSIEEPTSPTSPAIQKNPHANKAEGTGASDEPKPKMNLKDFAQELQQAGERTAILLNDRFNSVKAKIKEKGADALSSPAKMTHLEKLHELITGAAYQMGKACNILDKTYEKPTKPLKSSGDAESIIATMNFALTKFQTSCRDLSSMLLAAASQGAGGTPVSMKQAFGKAPPPKKKDTELAEKLKGDNAEQSLKNAGLDVELMMTLPSHFDLCMATVGFLLQAFAQITSLKGATGILLAGLRWKRKAAKKMAAKPVMPFGIKPAGEEAAADAS